MGTRRSQRESHGLLATVLIPLLFIGCDRQDIEWSEVTVRDQDFQTVRVIRDPATLSALRSAWHERETITPPERPDFSYKISILTAEGSTRWLYDAAGYATILSPAVMPVYHIKDATTLNAMLLPTPDQLAP